MLDSIDYKILSLIQENGKISNTELAEKIGLSLTPCLRRVKKLEDVRIVNFYTASLNRKKIGIDVTAFVLIKLTNYKNDTTEQFINAVGKIENIVACYSLSGSYDFILEVVATDLDDYSSIVTKKLGELPGVSGLQTSFVLKDVKPKKLLPIRQG